MLLPLFFIIAGVSTGEPERVEPGTVDVGMSTESSRQQPVGRAQPLSFEELTRIKGKDGEPGIFARQSGGIQAIFRQGIYADRHALVPPDTLYVIGEMPAWVRDWLDLPAESPQAFPDSRVDTRVVSRIETSTNTAAIRSAINSSADPSPSETSPGDTPPTLDEEQRRAEPLSIFTSETYRVRRMRALLADAAPSAEVASR